MRRNENEGVKVKTVFHVDEGVDQEDYVGLVDRSVITGSSVMGRSVVLHEETTMNNVDVTSGGLLRKSGASKSNTLLGEVGHNFEHHGGLLSDKLIELLTLNFRWEMVRNVAPLAAMKLNEIPNHWKLQYRICDKSKFHNHLYVKESGMKGAGYGVFADRYFVEGDIITVYLGKVVRNKRSKTTYKYDFGELGAIDPGKGMMDGQCLYLGAHFINDICHKGVYKDTRKKYNATFSEIYIVESNQIHRDTEIFVEYNRVK